jgi:Ni/Co efflux regulator RcnB
MADANSLAIKACEDAAAKYNLAMTTNLAIQVRNEAKTAQYRIDKPAWDVKKKAFDDKHARWVNSQEEYAKWADRNSNTKFWNKDCLNKPYACTGWLKLGEDHRNRCRTEAAEKKLPRADGYGYTGQQLGCGKSTWTCEWGLNFECGREQSSIDQVNAAYRNDEPTFTDTMPVDKTGAYAHELSVPTEGVIQCCGNTLDVSKGSVNKNIQQSCTFNNTTSEPVKGDTTNTTGTGASTTTGTGTPPEEEKTLMDKIKDNKVAVIVAIIIIIMMSLMSSVGLMFLM